MRNFFKRLFRRRNPIRIEKGQVKMIAHRGLSGLETENTLPAFRRAARGTYFGIETDVHVTADGAFVIFHDDTLSRMTDGASDLRIEETPLAELASIRLPDKSGKNRPEELGLPLLKEYIAACREGGKTCVLELKNPFGEADIDRLLAEIGETGWAENMIYISFLRENCLALRRRLPEAPIQFLSSKEIDRELIDFLKANRFGLDIAHRRLSPAAIEAVRAEGIELNCWTVDDPARAAALAASGVDFITTNILE